MDVSEALRRAYIAAIGTLTVNGTAIPVFDEFVNPNVPLPVLKLTTDPREEAPMVYVVIQDQQETEGQQNFCNYRQNCNITLRIVTIFNTGGVVAKRYAEAISDEVQRRIKPTGKTHALVNANGYVFQRVEKELSRGYTENTSSKTAINKVIIYNNVVNQ
ncbi:hypothetical protein BC792_12724 [Sphingobacterium allocomposti]|uniref:Uncharacterized protein n=1 Tax=Sphingobacterium allocomposti TaxID=415956 RepID=A0A5S5D063_9SPHI|nr:hypothetical protein [Sphingobacterium composti Yoo et al. 2007 non Ten et al. 2007]TYP89423.1 hypothetical protein BC792_12724 [Sphingobacterium composti Yoo et al. 2007 non Ten et al. 2007]